MPLPEKMLKEKIHKSNLSVRQVSDCICRPYGTVACWLNGFAPLPDVYRRKIEDVINNHLSRIDTGPIDSVG